MVEVFKTDVVKTEQANKLVVQIHQMFIGYKANFDLEDCDKILRVKCTTGKIEPHLLINLLKKAGFNAEVLSDEIVLLTD